MLPLAPLYRVRSLPVLASLSSALSLPLQTGGPPPFIHITSCGPSCSLLLFVQPLKLALSIFSLSSSHLIQLSFILDFFPFPGSTSLSSHPSWWSFVVCCPPTPSLSLHHFGTVVVLPSSPSTPRSPSRPSSLNAIADTTTVVVIVYIRTD